MPQIDSEIEHFTKTCWTTLYFHVFDNQEEMISNPRFKDLQKCCKTMRKYVNPENEGIYTWDSRFWQNPENVMNLMIWKVAAESCQNSTFSKMLLNNSKSPRFIKTCKIYSKSLICRNAAKSYQNCEFFNCYKTDAKYKVSHSHANFSQNRRFLILLQNDPKIQHSIKNLLNYHNPNGSQKLEKLCQNYIILNNSSGVVPNWTVS